MVRSAMTTGKGLGIRRIAVPVLGLLVSSVFIWLAVRHLDLAAIRDALAKTQLVPWLPAAVASYLGGHVVRGARLRRLVRREANVPVATASNVVVVGYASNNVLPARLGELVRAGMLAERTGMPLAQTLTITFIERLLDGVAILLLLVIGTLAAKPAGWVQDLAKVGSLVFGSAIAVLTFATIFPRLVVRLAGRAARPLGRAAYERAIALATSIVNATSSLRSGRDALELASLSLVVWCFEAMMFVFVLPAFGLPLRISTGVVAMAVTNLGILVPSTPGFIGPFHYFCSQALMAAGVEGATAFGYATLVHLAFFVPVTVWGAGAMLWYGVQLGETAARVREAKASPKTKEVGGVSAFVIARVPASAGVTKATDFDRALAEAVLPDDVPHTEGLVGDVADFFAGTMAALPSRIRVLYQIGMATFRFWVRVRYLRSFCGLDLARRRAVVESWAYGPLGHLRQLFRPVRSTILLAGYEHAEGGASPRRLPVVEDADG